MAYVLWLMAGAFVVLNFIFDPPFGEVGVLLAIAGSVLQVRGYFCAMQAREREAYELGRESVRSLR